MPTEWYIIKIFTWNIIWLLKKEIIEFERKMMDLEVLILSKVTQIKKDKQYVFSPMQILALILQINVFTLRLQLHKGENENNGIGRMKQDGVREHTEYKMR